MKTENIRIILASKSPRRKELIEGVGFKTLIIPSEADENIEEKDPAELVKKLSEIKAMSVYDYIKDKVGKNREDFAGNSNDAGNTDAEDELRVPSIPHAALGQTLTLVSRLSLE